MLTTGHASALSVPSPIFSRTSWTSASISTVIAWMARVSSVFCFSSVSVSWKSWSAFRLLEHRLSVLADHDERRQEDRFQRDNERQELERVPICTEKAGCDPDGKDGDVDPNEHH